MNRLLPCPFCGGSVEIEHDTMWSIWCDKCDDNFQYCGTEKAIIAWWNARAIDPRIKKVLDDIEQSLGMYADTDNGLMIAISSLYEHFPELKEDNG